MLKENNGTEKSFSKVLVKSMQNSQEYILNAKVTIFFKNQCFIHC